jgi:hypothetical protein
VLFGGGAAVGAEAQPLRAAHDGPELVEHGLEGLIPQRRDRDAMQVVVGVEGVIDVAGGHGLGESSIRGPHALHVVVVESTRHLAYSEFMHRGDDIARVPHRACVEGADRRRSAGKRHDEAARAQAQQGLAHRGAADPEPEGELAVLELLAGQEGAVDDGVPQAQVDVITEQ